MGFPFGLLGKSEFCPTCNLCPGFLRVLKYYEKCPTQSWLLVLFNDGMLNKVNFFELHNYSLAQFGNKMRVLGYPIIMILQFLKCT